MKLDGIYIALVVNNLVDKNNTEQIHGRVIGVHDMSNEDFTNVIPIENGISNYHTSGDIPEIGQYVYIQFLHNDPMKAIYFGQVKHNIEE